MKTKISRKVFCFVAIASLVFLLTAPVAASQAKGLPKSVGIATHPKGSLFNIVGSAFAKVFTAKLGIQATDRPYAGYIAWLPLLSRGEIDLGICTPADPHYAYHGLKPYREKNPNLRAISTGSTLNTGWVTVKSAGIRKISDLKGKRVCVDVASMSTKANQEGTLVAGGINVKKDIKVVPTAGVAEPVRAVIEGRSEATWAAVGMAIVKELIAKRGEIYWVPVISSADDPKADEVLNNAPGHSFDFVKAGKRRTVNNDTVLLAAPIYLMSHKDLSDEAAYQFAKTTWESQKDLIEIHPIFRGWTHKRMLSKKAVVPYHPGAIRFYKEKGVWSAEMEQVQKKFLGN